MINTFKLLSDKTRMRILMLLARKEMCVCQLMGVLEISQPLVSRNLALLGSAGLLNERRDGKLIFYSLKGDLPSSISGILNILKKHLKNDTVSKADLKTLGECKEFQKKTGKCDMKTFFAFMKNKQKQRRKRS